MTIRYSVVVRHRIRLKAYRNQASPAVRLQMARRPLVRLVAADEQNRGSAQLSVEGRHVSRIPCDDVACPPADRKRKHQTDVARRKRKHQCDVAHPPVGRKRKHRADPTRGHVPRPPTGRDPFHKNGVPRLGHQQDVEHH